MSKKKVSKRDVEDFPKISETHYKIIDRKDYVSKPKERLKSVMLVENKKNKQKFIRLIDRWVGHRLVGRGKGKYIWEHGKSFNIQQEDDLSMIAKILHWFGKKLGMKVGESSEELIQKHEQDIKELNQQLVAKTLKQEQLKLELAKKQEELELAKQVSGKIERFVKQLEELKSEIENSKNKDLRKEKEVKKKIRRNRWVLGLDCQVKAKEVPIDTQTALDLHIKTDLGEDRVFEFKSPNLNPFFKKENRKRLNIDKELSEGINQLIDYMKKADIYSNLEEEGTYKIKKPSGVIVMGYNLPKEQVTLLKNWNFYLRPHIRIVTYNDLLESAYQNLEYIKGVRKDLEKK